MKKLSIHLASIALILFTSCGESPQDGPKLYSYQGPGEYSHKTGEIRFPGPKTVGDSKSMEGLTPCERTHYCSVYIEQEDNELARTRFLEMLSGSWKKRIQEEPFNLFGTEEKSFTFDPENSTVATKGGMFDGEMQFERICLSKPVYPNDHYWGYRIVEFQAANNEGVAITAVLFHWPSFGHQYPTLLKTVTVYKRYGKTQNPVTIEAVFEGLDDEESVRIGVFPDKN